MGYEFPHYPVPDGETEMSFLRKRTEEGARERYQPYSVKARKQVEHELKLIEKLKLPGYFLIVWDIVQFCRANGILVQGRGSAANRGLGLQLRIGTSVGSSLSARPARLGAVRSSKTLLGTCMLSFLGSRDFPYLTSIE